MKMSFFDKAVMPAVSVSGRAINLFRGEKVWRNSPWTSMKGLRKSYDIFYDENSRNEIIRNISYRIVHHELAVETYHTDFKPLSIVNNIYSGIVGKDDKEAWHPYRITPKELSRLSKDLFVRAVEMAKEELIKPPALVKSANSWIALNNLIMSSLYNPKQMPIVADFIYTTSLIQNDYFHGSNFLENAILILGYIRGEGMFPIAASRKRKNNADIFLQMLKDKRIPSDMA
jgi:hypothetical protein